MCEHLLSDKQLDILKQTRKFRKQFTAIADIDFFAGEAQRQAEASLRELEILATRALSPDEPYSFDGLITPLSISQYNGRIWATRGRPWIDRLASAWLMTFYRQRLSVTLVEVCKSLSERCNRFRL